MTALITIIKKDYLLLILLLVLICLIFFIPENLRRFHTLVEWNTIAALAGLLIVATGVKESGYLNNVALKIIAKAPTERSLALILVTMAALLSTVLTNDVTLFIVVPLTLSLQRLLDCKLLKIVVFEAIAVNVGSALTPIGNPQNLFLWDYSQASFLSFTLTMLPLELILLGLLLVFTWLSFSGKALTLETVPAPAQVDIELLKISLALFLVFLIFFNLRMPGFGLLIVLPVYLWRFREVLKKTDWLLLVIFILMFIDLRLLTEIPAVTRLLALAGVDQTDNLFIAGIAISQLISNVPAAILLAEYSTDWRTIAYAVNLAGNGIVIGSLANIIALRMAQDKKIWLTFHIYSIIFLLISSPFVYGMLFWI